MEISKKNIDRIKQLCKQYKVKTFSAFGSVTRDDLKDDSDLDFVVDLEKLLQRRIDLIEERGIKNQFFKKELDSTKIPIYGQ